jgi:hypothetical protein
MLKIQDKMEIKTFKPELNARHEYAVALSIGKGMISPLKSYASEEQLEQGYREFYSFSEQKGLCHPVPVQKLEKGVEWNDARCKLLINLAEKIMKEQDPKRN